jgi:hypothetical protein
MDHMEQQPKLPRSHKRPRQIVGFSLPPDLAAEVKMEAARLGIPLRALFVELWALYKKKEPTLSPERHARKS